MQRVIVSRQDERYYAILRANVSSFLHRVATQYACDGGLLLDIAPQVHEGAQPHFLASVQIDTLDVDATSNATYIADICERNEWIAGGKYNYIVCTEVLEHTLRPFDAVAEVYRLLAPGGLLFLSVPFNFRIHGPLPDCWRFTEHGLRALLERWIILELREVKTPRRPLMPIHYTVVAQKPDDHGFA
jgi:hypothetical protein